MPSTRKRTSSHRSSKTSLVNSIFKMDRNTFIKCLKDSDRDVLNELCINIAFKKTQSNEKQLLASISRKSVKKLLTLLHYILHRSIKNSIKDIFKFGLTGGVLGFSGSRLVDITTKNKATQNFENGHFNSNAYPLFTEKNKKHGIYGALAGLGGASILELLQYLGFKKTTVDERKQIFKTFLPRLRITLPKNFSRQKS